MPLQKEMGKCAKDDITYATRNIKWSNWIDTHFNEQPFFQTMTDWPFFQKIQTTLILGLEIVEKQCTQSPNQGTHYLNIF
jgi:hypothetical protein